MKKKYKKTIDNKSKIVNIVGIMSKDQQNNQTDFIDNSHIEFMLSVQNFRESADTFDGIVKSMPVGSSAIGDWMDVLQSRLTALKKQFKHIQTKNQK